MTVGFTLTAKYGYRKIDRLIRIKGKDSVFIGVPDDAGNYHGKEISIAAVAWFNEFGTVNMPERPFLRWTLDEHDGYMKEIERALKIILTRPVADYRSYLKKIGFQAEADIKQTILTADFEPLAPSTVRRKGHDQPLFDTGLMMRSITSRLVRGE